MQDDNHDNSFDSDESSSMSSNDDKDDIMAGVHVVTGLTDNSTRATQPLLRVNK